MTAACCLLYLSHDTHLPAVSSCDTDVMIQWAVSEGTPLRRDWFGCGCGVQGGSCVMGGWSNEEAYGDKQKLGAMRSPLGCMGRLRVPARWNGEARYEVASIVLSPLLETLFSPLIQDVTMCMIHYIVTSMPDVHHIAIPYMNRRNVARCFPQTPYVKNQTPLQALASPCASTDN
ncbi:hypothetical protein F5X68DRAFT_81219 [Plectosphaerella plurivora]|uniref:Uncharacterized protein n=1 Tax=Plectosphaerella plurivora TaxID=936078 RepID=A0A9P9ABC8_9PEZI|nr:hypothetical protein F5X68DRAFT_81219 [Plectosphaerella plurivora]